MIIKLLSVFVIFGLCSKAFELPYGLDEKIIEAQEKISKFSKQSEKEITSTQKLSNEHKEYFTTSIVTYLESGDVSRAALGVQLNDMTKKYIGEAVDKGKNPNAFECIIKAMVEADTVLTNSKNTAYKCANDVFNKQTKEIENVEFQISYIDASTTGFYKQLIDSLAACSDEGNVNKLVQAGEARLNNLKKVLQLFCNKLSTVRSEFNQNQDNCLRNSQTGNRNALKTAENKMKQC